MSLPLHPLVIRRPQIEAAQAVESILAKAEREAADERARGRQCGYEEGLTTGLKTAAAIAEDFIMAIDQYWAAREDELVDAVLAIAHRVVAGLPPEDTLRGLVLRALGEHRRDTSPMLRANPDVAAALTQALADLPETAHISIRSDPTMPEGRFVLDHSSGMESLDLLQQFKAMFEQTQSL